MATADPGEGEHDPEMHPTAKGKHWYFGMKAHVGVHSKTKLIHTILTSAANVADRDALPHLLHGQETRVWAIKATRAKLTLSASERDGGTGEPVHGAS